MDALRILTAAALASSLLLAGCSGDKPKPYGSEARLHLNASRPMVWAIAPAVDYSGQSGVDPLLQADLVYQQFQEVRGLTIIPVNRTVQALWQLRIEKLTDRAQVDAVCRIMGCDGLVIPTVTAYDPYNPPKFGAALQLFLIDQGTRTPATQPSSTTRPAATTQPMHEAPALPRMLQAVAMYDASNGTVRERLAAYAVGRENPNGPLADKERYLVMERFVGFAWNELVRELVTSGAFGR